MSVRDAATLLMQLGQLAFTANMAGLILTYRGPLPAWCIVFGMLTLALLGASLVLLLYSSRATYRRRG